MKKLIYWLDQHVNLIFILFLFWGLFWILNGGDKFFNGQFTSNTDDWSAKGVIVDESGEIVYTLHPTEFFGLFGVNRDAKMINYFKNIHLPKELALFSLYGMAVLEIVLGLMFFALFFYNFLSDERKQKMELFHNRTIHRLAFKGSVLVFVIFSTGDILFGDRTELWEHGTFIILCLITYDMWYRTDRFMQEQQNNEDEPSSTQATSHTSDSSE